MNQNTKDMIYLCKCMIEHNKKSTSEMAAARLSLWQAKLKYWESATKS